MSTRTTSRLPDPSAIDIGIAGSDRKSIADALSRVLADTYMLYMQTHRFHWNVEGPMFNSLHLMFMEQYTELWNALDEVAERIRSLDFHAPGSCQQFSMLTSIQDVEGPTDALGMVRALLAGHQAVARTLRMALRTAESSGDDSTVDLLIQRLQIHEKTAWMLRSLLK